MIKMNINRKDRLPREIWIAAISLKGLWPAKTIEGRINDILERMENVYPFEPDVICLPETFQISWVNENIIQFLLNTKIFVIKIN